MPFSATAFLKPPLSLMTPQFVFGPNTKITTASSARALFLSPWTSLTKAPAASEAAMELQQKLRKLCSDSSIADRGDRIEELAKELNILNPTRRPALSPSLAGRWKLLYSNISGPSGGRVGPFLADVYQEIRPRDKRIVNILELGPKWARRGALEADVEVLDANTWALRFDFVRGLFAGKNVQYKKFDQATERRIWEMTYLDERFRVLYGRQESMPADEAYIFLMQRDISTSN
ncbi:unnamed protein product [Ascophyllum nodosum]